LFSAIINEYIYAHYISLHGAFIGCLWMPGCLSEIGQYINGPHFLVVFWPAMID
jgi:hypothetical protein